MIVKSVLLFFLITSGINGTDLDYTFNDQATGWLKLYTEPLVWNDAKIRCEFEGSVLATPLTDQLRDVIKQHVTKMDRSVFSIYTGVQAAYTGGDFLSVEGVRLSSLPVRLMVGANIDYKSSESCIAWDMTYNNLKKVKCDTKYPYVCYKKRTTVPVPTGDSTPEPESNSGVPPLPPVVQTHTDQRKLTQSPAHLQPNQRTRKPRPYCRTRTGRTQANIIPYEKCAVDGVNITIINSNLQLDAFKAFANNPTVLIIVADVAYVESRDDQSWHVVIQKKQPRINPAEINATAVTATVNVNKNLTQFTKGIQSGVRQGQGYTAVSRNITSAPANLSHVGASDNTYGQPPPKITTSPILDYSLDKQTGLWMKMHQPDLWDTAHNRCASQGAVLASPLTNQLVDAIKRYLLAVDQSVTTVYTGIQASFSNGDFYSTEGVSLKKMPVSLDWRTNTYESGESCIVMNTFNTVVSSVRCTERYPYICLKKAVVRGCGTRARDYKLDTRTSRCYKFHKQGQTWANAYNTCNNEGGYLAVINSRIESEVITDLFAENPSLATSYSYYPNSAYIGLRKWSTQEPWTTVLDRNPKTGGLYGKIRWATTEPNNAHGDEYCGTVNRNGYVYDDPCELKLYFICEKDSEILNYPNSAFP